MICIYADFQLSTITFIFYTCIWIPTRSFLRLFAFFHNPHHQPTPSCSLDLPVSRFCDLECSKIDPHEMCSICLLEFEKQDTVNKLGRCGHTFHVECMEKWLDTCRFTCPLCRSFLLHPSSSRPHSAPCHHS